MDEDVVTQAKNAGYAAVGFGVLAVQKLNVTGRALVKDVATGLRDLNAVDRLRDLNAVGDRPRDPNAGDRLRDANARDSGSGKDGVRRAVRKVEAAVDPVLDGVERRLPPQARTAFHRVRTVSRAVERILL